MQSLALQKSALSPIFSPCTSLSRNFVRSRFKSLSKLNNGTRAIATQKTLFEESRSLHNLESGKTKKVVNGDKRITSLPLVRPQSIQTRNYVQKVFPVPNLAESITEGTLKQWLKKIGEFVKRDDEIATIETDKIDVTINTPESGTLIEVFAKEEETVGVGDDLFKLELGDASAEGKPSPQAEQTENSKKKVPKDAEKPETTKKEAFKEDAKVEPREEPKKDTKPPAPEPAAATPPHTPPKITPEPPPVTSTLPSGTSFSSPYGDREERRVKMNRMRLRIAERLKEAQNTAASLTTFNEVDMSNLIDLRNQYKDQILKRYSVKLGFMSAFVKASVFALQEVPGVNASIQGLVTPVVRNVHLMHSFIDVERAIAELGQKARDGKITLEDMTGGTFTISNGGVYGSLYGTPIINLPQSAILGMHAVKERPVAINGKVEVRPMMYIALTYDHRLVDGREAVTFLKTVKEQVEDPRRLLLSI
ncbi:hypothetical protein G9A89_013325 [Geosiphon pyriformis]|nr:hypothetical protein G9A89_013325 [Geosiphon pyriformis]